jgi:hypothetical protein
LVLLFLGFFFILQGSRFAEGFIIFIFVESDILEVVPLAVDFVDSLLLQVFCLLLSIITDFIETVK